MIGVWRFRGRWSAEGETRNWVQEKKRNRCKSHVAQSGSSPLGVDQEKEDCVQMLQASVAHVTGLWSSAFGQDMRAMSLESAELSRQCPLPNRPRSTRPSLVQLSRGKAKSCSSKKKTLRGFPIVTESDLGHWFCPWWCSNKKTFGPNEVEISSQCLRSTE